MRAHRWSAVAIASLEEADAERLAATPMAERLDTICETFGPAPGDIVRVRALRGPICSECRVSWEDVHADPRKPWPCPGVRPDALGGPLVNPVASRKAPNRQQQRAKHRKAMKAGQRAAATDTNAAVRGRFEAAMLMDKSRRNHRKQSAAEAEEGMRQLGEHLAGAERLEEYLWS